VGTELHALLAECGDRVKASAIAIVGNGVTVVVRKSEWARCLHILDRTSLPYCPGKTGTTKWIQGKPRAAGVDPPLIAATKD